MSAKTGIVMETPPLWLKVVGVIASMGMLVVNLVGFLDAQTGSALGCGTDWPLCNGKIIPALSNEHVDIEFAHRALVGGFALVALVFLVCALIPYRRYIEVKVLAWLAIAFILIQAVLGALAVLFVNPPPVLALHLGFGLLAMVGTTLLTVFLFQMGARVDGRPSGLGLRIQGISAGTRVLVLGIWAYTYIAIYWGSYVAFRGAGVACPTWPLCDGRVFPGLAGAVGLDFIHRLFALGLAILSVLLIIVLRAVSKSRPDMGRGALWFLVVVLFQIGTGAKVALSHVATGPYILHVSTLMVLFVVLSYLGLQVMPASPASHAFPAPQAAASGTSGKGALTDP